jgi:hypothetical protein
LTSPGIQSNKDILGKGYSQVSNNKKKHSGYGKWYVVQYGGENVFEKLGQGVIQKFKLGKEYS